MKRYPFIVVLSLMFSLGFADSSRGDSGQIPFVPKRFQGEDTLAATLAQVMPPEEKLPSQEGEVDPETLSLIMSLRNPFLPQTPKAVIEEPPPAPVPPPPGQPTPPSPRKTDLPPTIPRPNFDVSGMIWDTNTPQAILNGEVVNLGDTVENWKVTKITREGVELSFQDVTITVQPEANTRQGEKKQYRDVQR